MLANAEESSPQWFVASSAQHAGTGRFTTGTTRPVHDLLPHGTVDISAGKPPVPARAIEPPPVPEPGWALLPTAPAIARAIHRAGIGIRGIPATRRHPAGRKQGARTHQTQGSPKHRIRLFHARPRDASPSGGGTCAAGMLVTAERPRSARRWRWLRSSSCLFARAAAQWSTEQLHDLVPQFRAFHQCPEQRRMQMPRGGEPAIALDAVHVKKRGNLFEPAMPMPLHKPVSSIPT